ncbi:hypothetical protein ACH5RR_018111 [Cinchona calisaya]|uniref:Uncharacterized protein n=1 Tax=Cinchona calisaya TaxID=153742 RepID=A0ABD2ZP79_9GENT
MTLNLLNNGFNTSRNLHMASLLIPRIWNHHIQDFIKNTTYFPASSNKEPFNWQIPKLNPTMKLRELSNYIIKPFFPSLKNQKLIIKEPRSFGQNSSNVFFMSEKELKDINTQLNNFKARG